jgi:hypothetical protein
MSESLFLLRDGDLKQMTSADFESEDVFQGLLARFPDLLTNADFGESSPRRWVLVSREASIADRDGGGGRWSLDHLFIDQDGVPTLVEVKRASDTRARREVVAQMLDYAANAVRWWKVDELSKWFVQDCEAQGVNSVERLGRLLDNDSPDIEAFWRSVQSNLTSGRIRMVFVADKLAPELERIVEFLNEQMDPAVVVALELRPFSNGSDRILSPRLVGATARAVDRKSVVPTASSVDEWFSTIFTGKVARREQVTKLMELAAGLSATVEVAGQSLGVDFASGLHKFRVVYIRANGQVALSGWMLRKIPSLESDQRRLELYGEFEAAGFKLSHHGPRGEPNFNLPALVDGTGWERLRQLFEKVSQAIASSNR